MQARTVRDTKIVLPGEDPDDLEDIDQLPGDGDSITEAVIRGDAWARVTLTGLTIRRSWLIGADLAASTITDATFDRCVFIGCTLVGATLDTITARDVIVENCRLDYATFQRFKATGPVAFLGCSFTEATITASTLLTAVFDGCKLAGLAVEGSDLRGADLRGNDLTGLTNATALRGSILSDTQLPAFTDLIVRELSINVVGSG